MAIDRAKIFSPLFFINFFLQEKVLAKKNFQTLCPELKNVVFRAEARKASNFKKGQCPHFLSNLAQQKLKMIVLMRGIDWCLQIFDILKNEFFSIFCHIWGEYNSQSHFRKKRLKLGQKNLRHDFFLIFLQQSGWLRN